MTYSEKLRDPRWQKKRLEILQRDNFTCKLCSDNTTELHVHHAAYKKGLDPWEYQDEWLHTVCSRCHEHAALIRTAICLNLMANRQAFDAFDVLNGLIIFGQSKQAFEVLKPMWDKVINEEFPNDED